MANKKNIQDYPYKLIKKVGRDNGYRYLINIKEIKPNYYSAYDRKAKETVMIDLNQRFCYLWNQDSKKLKLIKK